MEYPLKGLKEICSKVTLDEKPVKVHLWPGDKEVQELFNVLKDIDEGKFNHILYLLSLHNTQLCPLNCRL